MKFPEILEDDRYAVVLPITVAEELDAVKIKNKNEEARFQARRAVRTLVEKAGSYEVLYDVVGAKSSVPADWEPDKNDNCIAASAKINNYLLLTNDINMQLKAKALGVEVSSYEGMKQKDDKKNSDGWLTVELDDERFASLFSRPAGETFGLLKNQYLVVKHGTEEHVLKYNGYTFEEVIRRKFKMRYLDTFAPKDVYQICAMDSLVTNQFTVITGNAGTGKSLLALSYALWALKNGHISKIIVAVNPVKAKGTSDVGFYPGDKLEKLMNNNVGGMLVSKFGDEMPIEQLIQSGQLQIQTLADIRGSEIPKGALLYLPEMQNSSIELAKLAAQRVSEGAKIIAEGDMETQVDMRMFEGGNNGLRRYVEVFSGEKFFGHVNLPNIYRSKLAEVAERM